MSPPRVRTRPPAAQNLSTQFSARLRRRARLLAVPALALAAACGGDGGGGPSGPQANPAPVVTALAPAQAPRGAAEATVTVTGTGFVATSVVRFNGADRQTEAVSATELRARLTAADLAAPGTAQISVFTPAPGGGTSNAAELTIANPGPVIASLAPGTVAAGSPGAVVTLTGTGFVPQSEAKVNGAARHTEHVSATELRVTLTAADLAAAVPVQVTVVNPAPGGGTSAPAALAVENPLPAIAALTPGTVAAGSPGAVVTLTGSGFVPTSEAKVNGAARHTEHVSATELRVTLTAADLSAATPAAITVVNPAPGGGTSAAAALAVNYPVPAIDVLTPAFAPTGGAGAVFSVKGTGFVPQSRVMTGAAVRRSDFLSPTELRVTLSAAEVAASGTLELRVENPAPGGGFSNPAAFELRAPLPVITSLSADLVTVGQPSLALRVNGTGFAANSEVRVEGAARPTRMITPTQLEATLNVGDLDETGLFRITVSTPAPGGGVSEPVTLTVGNPVPVLAALAPEIVTAGGGAATVTVQGSGFVAQSVVVTGASERQTEFVSATELRVTLSEAEVAAAGTLELRVRNPLPGGGISGPLTLQLRAPAPTITSLDPAHTLDRQPSIELKVNGTGFTANSEVRFAGSARPTRRISATQVEATLNMGDLQAAGSFPVAVFTPGPGGGTSGTLAFEVRAPVPTVTSLVPAQVTVGAGAEVVVRVNGTGFRGNTQARVNGASRPTQVLSATQINVTLGAADVQAAGSLDVTAFTPAPGGGTSAAVALPVVNPVPQIDFLPSRGASAGRQGFTLTVHGSGFVPGAVVRWNGADRPTNYISATRVSASITSADVASPGAAQVTVHNPAPGGGTSSAAAMQVRAVPAPVVTASREVVLPTRDMVWSAVTGRLYASVPASEPTHGNSVVEIDPATGAITGSVFVGSDPDVMAISDDGRVMYVVLAGSKGIRRLSVAPFAAGLEFSTELGVSDISVMPGRPGTLAVSRYEPYSPSHAGVCLYDDGVRRSLCTPGHIGSNVITFGEASAIYGSDNESSAREFTTIEVIPTGLRKTQITRDLGGMTFWRYAAGRIYSEGGAVIDAERHAQVGNLTGGGIPAPDPALGRVFAAGFDGTLRVYDMNNFTSLGSLPAQFGTTILRWGTDGLAIRSHEKIQILRTPLAAP